MGNKGADQRKKMPTLPEFVAARDWTGALGLLKFELSVEENLADEGLVTERVSMSCKQSDCHTDRHNLDEHPCIGQTSIMIKSL